LLPATPRSSGDDRINPAVSVGLQEVGDHPVDALAFVVDNRVIPDSNVNI